MVEQLRGQCSAAGRKRPPEDPSRRSRRVVPCKQHRLPKLIATLPTMTSIWDTRRSTCRESNGSGHSLPNPSLCWACLSLLSTSWIVVESGTAKRVVQRVCQLARAERHDPGDSEACIAGGAAMTERQTCRT